MGLANLIGSVAALFCALPRPVQTVVAAVGEEVVDAAVDKLSGSSGSVCKRSEDYPSSYPSSQDAMSRRLPGSFGSGKRR